MPKMNEGNNDRIARIVLGVALLVVALATGWWLIGLIGLIPLVTGLIGFCPLYSLCGLSTCPMKDES